jgi:hypothetical protein
MRAAPILAAILAGALATGGGMAIYLKKANDDRERLAMVAEQTQNAAKDTETKSQQAIDAANKKVEDANVEVAKAQETVKQLQEERDRLAHATQLPPADPKLIKGWKDVVDTTLGVSCKTPSSTNIDSNDATSLAFSSAGNRWFSVTTYDERLEKELLANAASTTEVSYLINGRLCTGWKGKTLTGNNDIVLLRAESNGTSTHLLWARTPSEQNGEQILNAALSSLTFAQ